VTSLTISTSDQPHTAPTLVAIASLAAEHVLLKEISYLPNERKHLAKTLRWSLEEQLIDDIDDLHIAVATLSDDLAVAAIVRKELMTQRLTNLSEQHIQARHLVPEPLLLPWQADQWTAAIQHDGQRWLWRTGAGSGFACHEHDLQLMLKLSAEDRGLPEKIIIYSDNIERDKQHLPKALNHTETQTGALAESVEWRNTTDMPSVNVPVVDLLQGEFAPRIAWEKIWKQWRTTAFVAAAALIAQFIYAGVDYQLAKRQDVNLRQQIEQSYRQAIPTGNIIEPTRQLKRKLSSFSSTNSSHFMPILQDVTTEISSNKALSLQGLSYNEQKKSLQLTLIADNFNAVETLRNALATKGLEAKLASSNAEGSKVRARVQITGKQ
jgi:general secretion pathway protein L